VKGMVQMKLSSKTLLAFLPREGEAILSRKRIFRGGHRLKLEELHRSLEGTKGKEDFGRGEDLEDR